MLTTVTPAAGVVFFINPGKGWIWLQILCCCAFHGYGQNFPERGNLEWYAPEKPLPGNRTVWDSLPEISPWRYQRWSEVYSGQAKRVEDIQTIIDQAAKSAIKRIVIPPGIYHAYHGGLLSFRLKSLEINGLEDTEIVADGKTMPARSNAETVTGQRQ